MQGTSRTMSRSAEQAAKNLSTFRRANETLEAKASEFGLGDEPMPYLCECEDERCMKIVRLNREEYEAVRANPKRFLVLPSHREPEDLVVQEVGRYTVIEKTGEAGDLVAESDPRSANASS